nr:MAG TPA: hypothetical protein [Caudoviricetes sp.]
MKALQSFPSSLKCEPQASISTNHSEIRKVLICERLTVQGSLRKVSLTFSFLLICLFV